MVANGWKQVPTRLPLIAENGNVYTNFLVLDIYFHSMYCLRIQNYLQNSN